MGDIVKRKDFAGYLETLPKQKRGQTAAFIEYMEEHKFKIGDVKSWMAYTQSLNAVRKSGRMKGDNYYASTQGSYITAMKDFLRHAVDVSDMPASVSTVILKEIDNLKAPKRGKPNPKKLTAEQVKYLADNVEPDLSLMIEFLFYTSIRVSEMLGLTIKKLKRTNGHYQARLIGKGKLERDIRIPVDLYERVRSYFDGKTYLFETEKKKPFHRSDISMKIKRAAKKILKDDAVSAHTIRHSRLQDFYNQTHDLKKTQSLAGHRNSKTTADFYLSGEATYEEQDDTFNEAWKSTARKQSQGKPDSIQGEIGVLWKQYHRKFGDYPPISEKAMEAVAEDIRQAIKSGKPLE